MENIVVSNVNSYGFKITWNATDGSYDGFNIMVRDSGRLLEPVEHRVSGDHRSINITGLITGIGYDINVYGVARGKNSKPLFAQTTTGIFNPEGFIACLCMPLLPRIFFSFLYNTLTL